MIISFSDIEKCSKRIWVNLLIASSLYLWLGSDTEGEKNCLRRVVYLSDDALMALKLWLSKRKPEKDYLFYRLGTKQLCYTMARNIFTQYLREAGLQGKGYTLHSLRRTFASELLNAGIHGAY